MDSYLYDVSIPAISSLQRTLSSQANLMQLLSVLFDPKYAFLLYSPIAYLLDNKVGKKLILTTVIAEWLNQVLKWFLHGERPYWYVHSSGHFDPQQTPIQQFPITCELGPGHPSGHAMVTAAVWYIILDSALSAYCAHEHHAPQIKTTPLSSSSRHHLQAKLSVWTLYFCLLLVVSVSRVFLGCHFPHQCMAGAALGLLVARWVSGLEARASHYLFASAFLFVTAFGTFGLLSVLGLDPAWTIKMATTYCSKREYIHLDTAPFFSIMRYCGFALGCGLGLAIPLKNYAKQLVPIAAGYTELIDGSEHSDHQTAPLAATLADTDPDVKESNNPLSSRNLSWFSAKLLMAVLMARLVDNLGLFVSHANLTLFYSSAFFAYTMFSYAIINLSP